MATVYRSTPAGTIYRTQTQPPRLLARLRFTLRAKHDAYRTEQELLGHKDVSTTIYTRVLQRGVCGEQSPLDALARQVLPAGPLPTSDTSPSVRYREVLRAQV